MKSLTSHVIAMFGLGVWCFFCCGFLPLAQAQVTESSYAGASALDRIKAAKQALDYVRTIERTHNCTGGTEETLTLNFDHDRWMSYSDPAIRTANYLSKILAIDGDLSALGDDKFYALVRNNVHGGSLIFGSAIALEPDVIAGRTKFCPYAFRDNGSVRAFDIAINYDYQQDSTEWYHAVRISNLSNISVAVDRITIDDQDKVNGTIYLTQPVAAYPDGHWTYPYYDCGGGDIWMTTYSAPIMAQNSEAKVIFRGVATIDIELTNLDINQCDLDENEDSQALDVFRGTHNCQPTTQCVPLKEGFRSGAYLCQCKEGYYFPNTTASEKAFRGSDIDYFFETQNSIVRSQFGFVATQFQCLRCARGCDSCVDSRPCLYQINIAVQALVIFLVSAMILGCIVVSIITFTYRKELVIKTASPIFLQLMCLGAILMCSSVFVLYGEVTSLACTIRIWPYHLGFGVMYGALLLKTWRISVIFKQGGTMKRVNLPDKALLQRLVPLVALVVVYLGVWSAIHPPLAETVKTSKELKFFVCSMSWWSYAMFGVQALLLLVGVYLCFTVRKAPAHFNESKFITWATYNAIILGSFILMLTQFVGMSVGPDVVFVLHMAQQQVFVTITMALIFAPKFWALYRGSSNAEGRVYSNHVVTITGRVKPSLAPSSSRFSESTAVTTRQVAVQCNPDDFLLIAQEDDNSLKVPSASSSSNYMSKYSAKVSPACSEAESLRETNGTRPTSVSDA
ncbi:probable G-protein coupled receptor CG31760 [Aplysia californica]|uniref:Probable G-protein coupled receptor CG31760 n=1 Tax=Aplysia californica TaxID=6500 RepID=A0ABM1A8R1_APLCA|nr:probable G-protein coupled receptor CG31760 [Aplysia californica]